jgi:hypothetical protein
VVFLVVAVVHQTVRVVRQPVEAVRQAACLGPCPRIAAALEGCPAAQEVVPAALADQVDQAISVLRQSQPNLL